MGSLIGDAPKRDPIPISKLNPERHWIVPIGNGLAVDNSPPWRFIIHDQRTIAQYPVGDVVQERLALIQLVQQKIMTAEQLARAWGLHRNTLGNWAWRYRHFGLDGLVDGRLPSRRERLEAILEAAEEIVGQRGRKLSAVGLGRELRARGLGTLPATTLHWLRGQLLRPRELSLLRQPEQDEPSPAAGLATGGEAAPSPAGEAAAPAAAPSPPPAPEQRSQVGEPEGPAAQGPGDGPLPAAGLATGGEAAPSPAGEATAPAAAPSPPPAEPGGEGSAASPRAEGAPRTPADAARPLRYAGLGLALPAVQALLQPVEGYLEAAWGDRPWRYRPRQLIEAVLFYLLADYRNAEQVKASPTRDLGVWLGRRRAPACVTLRRRLPAMARRTELVEALQVELALQYLHLGWVQPGPWLVDGHFTPYFGRRDWGKGWWPQRRLAVRGRLQHWVHDCRGRPLWLHVTQGFELFADQLPVLARGVRGLLAEAGAGSEPLVLVFDRGGYSSQVFTALNREGVGWVTWIRGKIRLPAGDFREEALLPGERKVWYTRCTWSVAGCPTPIPAIVWHEGDPQQQVGLLTNVDHLYPGRWTAPELITLLRGRWAQENAFKAMRQKTDVHWTGGYVHEPAADIPVPNPRIKRWHQRLAFRTAQLRRAMDRRDAARDPRAERAWHRRVVALQAQVRRLQRQLARTPATVPYGSLGRGATAALHRGRGLLWPVLRAVAYHIRLQLRDAIAQLLPDHREWDKALRVLLHTPGVYRAGADGDWVVLQRPQLPRYARVLERMVDTINANPPHAPGRPGHPLRFALDPA
jgi:transposase-like protein